MPKPKVRFEDDEATKTYTVSVDNGQGETMLGEDEGYTQFNSIFSEPIPDEVEQEMDKADEEEADARLIPAGKYEGVFLSWEKREGWAGGPYEGKPMANVAIELYNVNGLTRRFYANLTNQVAYQSDGKPRSELRNARALMKATETKNLADAMAVAKDQRLLYKIGKSGSPARNWLNGISKVRE